MRDWVALFDTAATTQRTQKSKEPSLQDKPAKLAESVEWSMKCISIETDKTLDIFRSHIFCARGMPAVFCPVATQQTENSRMARDEV
ncbi:uncharacterized protein SPSK_10135 [Sporothrix schenckii 1099-18]|uniref:Uncharacterized protein n=1 Tax=Sporothrix schenckii 1099-18 TaxID=1397361 RepID=A0A0F2M4T3_SPOSC|nr:uncharacterized protein SPSK_10135 [Sporothrix schenckii 1099-18]KJR84632.1 hypothetical protein SPSK_10135 [Sporothrix schenckii 1099-18]